MMPGGGYAGRVHRIDGSEVIYQFIWENGKTEGEPEFPNGMTLEDLSFHEWGHSFLHTAFAKCQQERAKVDDLFKPVAKLMRDLPDKNMFNHIEAVLRIGLFPLIERYAEKV